MANWQGYRISDIVSEIDDGKYVLPVIQRGFVWNEDKIELLFDTVLKGDSFGSIIVIEEDKGNAPLFNYRNFSRDGSATKSMEQDILQQTQYFVIDGQQRLQSFYLGLKGSLDNKTLYFDLFSDPDEFFEFKFHDTGKQPKTSKEICDRSINRHLWVTANGLYKRLKESNDEDSTTDQVIEKLNIIDHLETKIIGRNIKAFYKNIITAHAIGISKIALNRTMNIMENRQKIVELFRRLNDGGTKLSGFDLVASILKGFDWQMEAFLEQILASYGEIGLSHDNLIKLIFILQDNHNKEMVSIERCDAEFAIKYKDRIIEALETMRKILKYSNLYSYFTSGSKSFIPLYFIIYHVFHKDIETDKLSTLYDNHDTSNRDFDEIKKWLYHSLINGVFRSKGAGWISYKTGIRKILLEIKNHKNQIFPKEQLFNVYYSHPINFNIQYNVDNLNDLDHSFIMHLIYPEANNFRKQDIDHIMPKSILHNNGYDQSQINNIKNYQLLDIGTNRYEKSNLSFSKWLSSVNFVVNQPAYIKKHLIPENTSLWVEKNFELFSLERGKLIVKKIAEINL